MTAGTIKSGRSRVVSSAVISPLSTSNKSRLCIMKLRGVFASFVLRDNDILELLLSPHRCGDPTSARLDAAAAVWPVVVLRATQRRRVSVRPPWVGLRRPYDDHPDALWIVHCQSPPLTGHV